MAHHSRITKISKLLRKLRKDQAARKTRWQKFHGDQAPVDYISRRGLLLCYFTEDYPIKRCRPRKSGRFYTFEDPQLWKNFDLKAHEVLKNLMSQENHPIIALIQKINDSPIPLCHWILEKENPSLGIYMEQLAKPLRDYSAFYAELCLPTDQIKACPFPKQLPASIRNAAKNVLDLLQDQLFQDTSLLSQEKSLFIETYRLSYQKQLDPYSFKQRSKARKSTHPIDEKRAVYVIEWLIEEILCTASLGAAFTLLYIWITLQAAFAGVRTSVDEILRLSAPSSISHNLQKLPVIKG